MLRAMVKTARRLEAAATAFLLLGFASVVPTAARAEEPKGAAAPPPAKAVPAAAAPTVPEDLPRLVDDTGRFQFPKSRTDRLTIQMHGEMQLRGQVMGSIPLTLTAGTLDANPGAIEGSLGQKAYITQWVRLTPELQYRKWLKVVAQLNLFQGYVFGDQTHEVWADQQPRDNSGDAWSYVQLRWLYAELLTKIGLFRVGQQSNHWGMGILANDGDHPSFFGDYHGGNLVEQVLFATKPAGIDSPYVLALGGDLVYSDPQARLTRGDIAVQGVLAGYYQKGPNLLGVFATIRSQTTSKQSMSDIYGYSDDIVAGVVDVAGHFAQPVPGSPTAYVYGGAEAAFVLGSTNELRQPDQALTGDKTRIASYGGAASLGVVHARRCGDCKRNPPVPMQKSPLAESDEPDTWGDVAAQVEVGYASGDANPYDTTEHRFTFDPNHRVGLVLFDEVMRWETARSAVAAQDPLLQNGNRPTPGVNLLPSNGGVFGAQYVYPTIVVRPRPWLDLKAGAVFAQTTADLVDPYRLATSGSYVNYRGGEPRRHDLGIELDGGFEFRIRLDRSLRLQLGAQGGVLFPGGAFDDAAGQTMRTPWLAQARVGLQF